MPFTPSHAVVALPFVRTPLVPAAVAVGAMTPDLPLFVRGTALTYGMTHALNWLPVTALVALGLLLLWRGLVRPAVRELSPESVAVRLPVAWDGPPRRGLRETFPGPVGVLWLLAALAIGVASHILWDVFTHEGRTGVEALPALDAAWGPLPGYRWLQHGSSAVGLAVLGAWGLRRLIRQRPATVTRLMPDAVRWTWWLSLPVVLAVAWLWGMAVYGPFTAEWTPAHLAYRVLPPAGAVWGALTIALCVGVVVRRARQSQAGSSSPHGRGAANEVGPPS